MSICRFAQLTGLSVKALRHDDETGLLEPAHVDPQSGYRWYRPGQARQGATISVLRSMGVPQEVVRQVLAEPERGDEHVQQHYLGVLLDPDALDGDPHEGAALMESGWQDLHTVVTQAGGSASPAWTTICPQDGGDPGRLLLCLGLDEPWSAGRAGSCFEAGTLPDRTELVVVLAPDDLPSPQELPGDVAPPAALIALMDALDRDDAPPETIRQSPLVDAGGLVGLEISVSLSCRPSGRARA